MLFVQLVQTTLEFVRLVFGFLTSDQQVVDLEGLFLDDAVQVAAFSLLGGCGLLAASK